MDQIEVKTKNLSRIESERPSESDTKKKLLLGSQDYKQRLDAKAKIDIATVLRAVIYCRVSTKMQADPDKTSMPNQLEKCHAVIKQRGWQFINEYKDEGISGHLTIERSGLQSMLRDAREGKFDLIVMKDYDRLARNKDAAVSIRHELKKLGIQIYALNTPSEPKSINEYDPEEDDSLLMMEVFSDMRSDLERNQIRRRMKEGRDNVAKKGILPNRVPYGYKVVKSFDENQKVKRSIEVNEEAADRVRYIFNQYISGTGDRKITISMNDKGWKSPQGKRWTTRGVKYILGNQVYTGKVMWGWRHAIYSITKSWIDKGKMGHMFEGTHTPLIDEVTFLKAQEIRQGRKTKARGGMERSFGVLTGIAKCIRCGSGVGYQRRYHKRSKENPNWNDTITYEYVCTGYKYSGICSSRVMSGTKLEGAVIDHIKNLYNHPKVQEQIVFDGKDPDAINQEKEIQRLEREMSKVEEKENRHTDAYERGVETLDQYQANIKRIRDENQQNHMAKEHLLSQCSLSSQKMDIMAKLVNSMHDFDNFWNALQLDEKKLILRSIIKEIRAGDGKVEIDFIL